MQAYKKLAFEQFGRDIQLWVHTYVVQRDSYREAKAYVDHYVLDKGDAEMADRFLANTPEFAQLPDAVRSQVRYGMMAGSGGYPLLGNADEIVDAMRMVTGCGVDGTLLTWIDYREGLAQFGASVLPRLEQAGLRKPRAPVA